MNSTLVKAVVAFVPVLVLLCGAGVLYARTKAASALVQALGATFFLVVVLAHVCEALNLLPSIGWGAEDSVGHYIDLASAVSGVVFFSVGYLIYALRSRKARAA
jgi:hypothetical protein